MAEEKIRVWTKQHENVWKILKEKGRFIQQERYVSGDLGEHAELMRESIRWLAQNSPDLKNKPADVTYPIWVSFLKDATMLKEPGTVILELELDPGIITHVNIEKWGTILNYSYIPADTADAARHHALLAAYGVSDTKAYMTQFYPEIKREIRDSWKRLFDPSILIGSDLDYGIIWELRKEWVREVEE